MSQEKASKTAIETLKKKEKKAQLVCSLLTGIVIVQCLAGVFLTYVNGFSVFTVMPAVFVPIMIMSFVNLRKIREAIASAKE